MIESYDLTFNTHSLDGSSDLLSIPIKISTNLVLNLFDTSTMTPKAQ